MRTPSYKIKLKHKEIEQIKRYLKKGVEKARKLRRCRILLLSHKGKKNKDIVETLSVAEGTVINVKRRYLKEGLEQAINEKERSGQPVKFNGRTKARITAIACSKAPQGHSKWSLRLLADKAVELKMVDSITHVTVGSILKKTS